MAANGGVMTLKEVAERLGISQATAYKLVQKGMLPAARVGRQWRIAHRDLEAYLTGANLPSQVSDPSAGLGFSPQRDTVRIKFVLMSDRAKRPVPGVEGDVGWDLCASRDIVINPHTYTKVSTDVRIELPPCIHARIIPRTTVVTQQPIVVHGGTVSPGYHGELFVYAYSLEDPVPIHQGDAIAQLVFNWNVPVEWEQVDELSASVRGTRHPGVTAFQRGSGGS